MLWYVLYPQVCYLGSLTRCLLYRVVAVVVRYATANPTVVTVDLSPPSYCCFSVHAACYLGSLTRCSLYRVVAVVVRYATANPTVVTVDLSPPSYCCFSVRAARILRCCVLSLRLLRGAYASVHGLAAIIVAPAVYLCVLHGFFTVCISRLYRRRSMHLLSHELAVLPRLLC